MNFKFYEDESRIADFLKFPRLLYFSELEEFKKRYGGPDYEGLIFEGYREFCAKAEERLKPYSGEIEVFYFKSSLSKYDFIDLMTKADPLIGCAKETDYLDRLSAIGAFNVRRCILYSAMMIEQEMSGSSEEVMSNAASACREFDQVIGFIKQLSISSGDKWNLYLIAEDPVKYARMYSDLMRKLLPIFKELYEPFLKEVVSCGKNLSDAFNRSGPEGFLELTCSIVDPELLNKDNSKLLISAMFPYTFAIGSHYVIWGLKMEEAFRYIKKANENRVSERVQFFKALGDKTRYEVLKLIASGQTSVKEIAGALNVSGATVSYHINTFLTSKVLKLEKFGNKYRLTPDLEMMQRTLDGFREDLGFGS